MTEQEQNKKKKTLGDWLLTLILLAAIAVFCFAAYKLVHIYLEYKQGTDEYSALEKMAVTERDPDKIENPEEQDPGKNLPVPPITVDFLPLKYANEDVVGWIYMEALPDISYPVVRAEDNDYYLHRTYEGTYNFAGSIFMDYENKRDFSDCNTIIYGHNMKNGSMFGLLSRYITSDAYQTSPYFWIMTPEIDYRYEIFSAYRTGINSETYTLFMGPGQEFMDYANHMQANSEIQTEDISMEITDRLVTLSTCTSDSSQRLVVQGKLVDEVPAAQ